MSILKKLSIVAKGTALIVLGLAIPSSPASVANAFPKVGGVGYIRVDPSFINLYGTPQDRSDFIKILNINSDGVFFSADDSTATSNKNTPVPLFAELIGSKTDLNQFGKLVYEITSGISAVNRPDKPINLLLGYELPSVVVGAACVNSSFNQDLSCTGNHTFQALDLADIQKFPSGGGSLFDTPSSVIAHELTEASHLTTGVTFNTAHSAAIVEQNRVLASMAGGQRDITIGSRSLPSGVDPSRTSIHDDSAYYRVSRTEQWILFPWIAPLGEKGWEIFVLKSSVAGWEITDLKTGIIDTGVP